MKQAFEDSGSFDKVTVASAPLVTLMGADLPAVLLEVGCIHPTVPLTQQQFERQVDNLAGPIADAIAVAIKELGP